jgi:radical SAM superfamily enzyme YgiQ (UPF0313 family)
MAKIALIKMFTGLNLGVSQLAGELEREGHEHLVIYFKDFYAVPREHVAGHHEVEYSSNFVGPRGREFAFNCVRAVSEKEYDLLFDLLGAFKPDLVGFSLTSTGMSIVAEVTRRVSEALSVPTMWGGAAPTVDPQTCIRHADYVCVNEGEQVIVEVARRLDRGEPLNGIPGLWVREGTGAIPAKNRPLVDLDSIAIPVFDPKRTAHIESDTLSRDVCPMTTGGQYSIMTSRGCPFSCDFCVESAYQDMFGKKGSLRRREVDVVIRELRDAKRDLGIRAVMFYDDVFTINHRWLAEFASRYGDEIGLPFWCYTYPTTTRPDIIRLLRDAGCVSMTMGIQSGSERVLREHFNRPTPLDGAIKAMNVVLDAGILCHFDLITEVEFETEDDARSTVEFLMRVPREARIVGMGGMVRFPNYRYTKAVDEASQTHAMTRADYRYYHRLYAIALSSLPLSERRAIAAEPLFRMRPELMEPYLPTASSLSYIPPEVMDSFHRRGRVLDTGVAQTTLGPEVEEAFPVRMESRSTPSRVLHKLPLVAG